MVGALPFHEASYKVKRGIGVGVKSPTADILGQEEKLRPQSTVRHKRVPRAKAVAQLWSLELETQTSRGWASITALTDRLLPMCLGSCWRLASPTSAPLIRSPYPLPMSTPHIHSPYPLPVSAPWFQFTTSGSVSIITGPPPCIQPSPLSLSACLCPNLPFTLRTPGVRLRATLPQHDPTTLFPNSLPFSVLGLRTSRRPWGQSSTLAPRKHREPQVEAPPWTPCQ